ncbi:MAG: M23 family metallopeptidase [Spirochaetaceae bacterium]|jgi:murein DD-endopeptidase MepM/ murein hydrolase activator NlpD|nr:M23 family metallopeptidase [Spirochaetaceae bacterium]
MKYHPGYIDVKQHIERRKPSRHTQNASALKNAARQQPRFIRQPLAQNAELRRKAAVLDGGGRSRISSQFIVAAIGVLGAGIFAYFTLLFQSDEFMIRPDADSRVFNEILEYSKGFESAAGTETDDIPLTTAETFSWSNYTVQRGDSVSKIAASHSLSMDAIIASNDLKNARNLHTGDIIRIPNMDGIPYTVAKGDSYQKIAASFNVPIEAILDANDIQDENISIGDILFIPGAKMKSEDLKLAMGELFIYPVNGRLTSGFGWRKDPFTGGERRFHSAIDLSANLGAPVKAAMDGKVSTVGFNAVFGRYLILTHSAGYQTMYAHLNSCAVIEGQKVKQGEKIGEVGNTGRSTGPHLHFAVYKNGRAINPLEHLKF